MEGAGRRGEIENEGIREGWEERKEMNGKEGKGAKKDLKNVNEEQRGEVRDVSDGGEKV